MRYFTLLFVILVGLNAQADTRIEHTTTVSFTSAYGESSHHNASTKSEHDEDNGSYGSKRPPFSSSTHHRYEFTLPETSRFSSTGRLLLNNPEPDYQVEIELSVPPSPSFVIGYAVNLRFYQHWLTRASLTNSRISGWKDSNLLYSHRQYPDGIAFS